jgi:hypothetical protein
MTVNAKKDSQEKLVFSPFLVSSQTLVTIMALVKGLEKQDSNAFVQKVLRERFVMILQIHVRKTHAKMVVYARKLAQRTTDANVQKEKAARIVKRNATFLRRKWM